MGIDVLDVRQPRMKRSTDAERERLESRVRAKVFSRCRVRFVRFARIDRFVIPSASLADVSATGLGKNFQVVCRPLPTLAT